MTTETQMDSVSFTVDGSSTEADASSHDDLSLLKKRALQTAADHPVLDDDHAKRLRLDETQSQSDHASSFSETPTNGCDAVADTSKLDALRKQLEYYFSDINMRKDRFFQSKIREDPEGWLNIKYILSCRKIKDLNVNQDDVLAVLATSDLETKCDEQGTAWLRRTTPLPPLDPDAPESLAGKTSKIKKTPKPKRSPSCPTTPSDIHLLGCFLKIANIPEEVSWVPVKKALQSALPEGAKLRHVSTVSPKGDSYVYCRKFTDDVEFFKKTLQIEVNNVNLSVELVDDVDTAALIIDHYLPKNILRDREKEASKLKAQRASKPLMVGETRFENVEHLRKCYKELLDLAVPEENLKPVPFRVIRSLLDYHPNAAQKTRDLVNIKVAFRTDIQTKPGEQPPKCFFVVRSDGSSEDVSMMKCIEGLMRNPPYCDNDSTNTQTENAPEEVTPAKTIVSAS